MTITTKHPEEISTFVQRRYKCRLDMYEILSYNVHASKDSSWINFPIQGETG